jgi:hypothetical protein
VPTRRHSRCWRSRDATMDTLYITMYQYYIYQISPASRIFDFVLYHFPQATIRRYGQMYKSSAHIRTGKEWKKSSNDDYVRNHFSASELRRVLYIKKLFSFFFFPSPILHPL